jgi:hypothetical protein
MGVYFPDDEFHPDIPCETETLWRYIDFTQFISLIETGHLWFSAASNFTDKWEGGLTAKQVERISETIPSFVEDNVGSVRELYDALRATTYVSCWHYRDEETAAMWELYNDRGKEVAIKTTVGKLRKAVRWSDDMLMGCVEYKDYVDGGDLFPITRESPFFHKRSSFEPEQEFRIMKGEFNMPERAAVSDGLKELVANKGGPGRSVSVNRSTLIDEVVMSPVAGGWLKGLVEEVLDTYEMDDVEVSDSKLGSDPFSAGE